VSVASAVATGAVADTDLLPRHLGFLPSERGDESLEPPPQARQRPEDQLPLPMIGFSAKQTVLMIEISELKDGTE
jgi:hypothetical protein